MNRRVVFLVCIAPLCARPAVAQRAYFDGTNQSTGTNCPVTGTPVTVLQARTGYFTDPSEPFPKTGDISYVHAVGTNISPCVTDVVGFEFFLPDGASLAISATNPVYCIRGRTDNGFWEYVPNDTNGSCSQTPSTGPNNGLFFGYSKLPNVGNWWLEIQVPVLFNKKLLGIGGPVTHRLTVAATSAYPPYTVAPFQPVTAFYQAAFASLASSAITSNAANLAFDLKSYFHDGTLYVDYGTTAAVGSSLPPVSVPNSSLSFPITASLSALSASTQYFWRARFVTTSGTFTSPVQTFNTTSAAPSHMLTVGTAGFGAGTLTSSPAGINCGLTCSASFLNNTVVTMTPTAAAGSYFSGWGGDCTGTGACSVTMSAARTVYAGFARLIGSLNLTLGGLPAGAQVTLGISGPDGFNTTRTMTTGTGTGFSDVATGTYTVTAPTTSVSGSSYAPTAASQNAVVNFGTTTTVDVTYSLQGLAAPSNVVATPVTSTSVLITWNAAGGTTCEVLRVAAGGATTTIGSTGSGSLTDATASANTSYLYKVRVIAPSVTGYSDPDLATTVIFTDPALVVGTTAIKAVHFTQLRTAVDAVRALAGLGAAAYTDATLSPGVTVIQAIHVTNLRSALVAARNLLPVPATVWQVLTAGTTVVSAADINALRAGVR